MRSDNLQLPCVEPPPSSAYNLQLPLGRHGHHGRHGHGGHGDHDGHGGHDDHDGHGDHEGHDDHDGRPPGN